jgi:hypothetical protein
MRAKRQRSVAALAEKERALISSHTTAALARSPRMTRRRAVFMVRPRCPPGLGGGFPPGCTVLAMDKDDRNGLNGDNKKPGPGNPDCRPASP